MSENPEKINEILERLEDLQKKQEMFSKEIFHLRSEVTRLKITESVSSGTVMGKSGTNEPDTVSLVEKPAISEPEPSGTINEAVPIDRETDEQPEPSLEEHSSLEKFIGENLINKIGIGITVIGVSLGVKYTIDHDLISPLVRILLGYFAGIVLLVAGIRLKSLYRNYSAVLVSGSMAIMYFITYAAFTFYALMPQTMAFALMVAITVYTVYTALQYDRQVIALIGLVGAYAIPFLLSNDPGQAVILLSYVAIINVGILVVAIRRYWEPLYFAAFVITWLIYFSWYGSQSRFSRDYDLAFQFLTIFFVIFYLAFMSYKVTKKEKFDLPDILLLLANSSIFYGIGYSVLKNQPDWQWALGLFTILNAVIHFGVLIVITYRKLPDKNLFNFIQGLVLVFVTIAVPVQLDGYWITLLYSCEAALLFWIGRSRQSYTYELLSYPLMIMLVYSLMVDWTDGYYHTMKAGDAVKLVPLFNQYFLTSMFAVASFAVIHVINTREDHPSTLVGRDDFVTLVSYFIPAAFLILLYFSFRNEIYSYWDHRYAASMATVTYRDGNLSAPIFNGDFLHYKTLWLENYSLLFLAMLSYVNTRKFKDQVLGYANLVLNIAAICLFLTLALYIMGVLRDNYLGNTESHYYKHSIFNLWIRYISLAFFGLLLHSCYKYTRQEFLKIDLRVQFDLVLHISVAWVLSTELVTWMNIEGSTQSYKLGLSILWGVYSLLLISLGIWKKKKHLRIGAITLFAATLAKLFFYDLKDLDTISKTIVFVSLGVLLLIISFLYNKYTAMISD